MQELFHFARNNCMLPQKSLEMLDGLSNMNGKTPDFNPGMKHGVVYAKRIALPIRLRHQPLQEGL